MFPPSEFDRHEEHDCRRGEDGRSDEVELVDDGSWVVEFGGLSCEGGFVGDVDEEEDEEGDGADGEVEVET